MLYIEFLDLIHKRILSSEIESHPFPHMVFRVNSDEINFDENMLEKMEPASGRILYNFKIGSDERLSKKLHKIGEDIKTKFNISIPTVKNENEIVKYTNYSEMWLDGHELDIQEIHLDYLLKNNMYEDGVKYKPFDINDNTQTVFSMHIYIPDDDNHKELGTTLYSEPTFEQFKSKVDFTDTIFTYDVTEDNYMDFMYCKCDPPISIEAMIVRHFEHIMKKEKKIPYEHGYVFIHQTTPNSWHSAPKVPEGYIRKSIMTRWDYTVLIPSE